MIDDPRLRAIQRALPDMMFVQSADGVYLDYSARYPSELLVAPQEFLGRSMWEILPEDLARRIDECFRSLQPLGEAAILEYSLVMGGETRFYEARIVLCDDGTFLSIVSDTTARRGLEQDNAALGRTWRLAALAELTSAMAHDLSQPLTAMMTNAHAARTAIDDLSRGASSQALAREALMDIVADGLRASDRIRHMRELFAAHPAADEWISMNDVIRRVLRLLRNRLDQARAHVALSLHEPLPKVLGDRVQLQLVCMQLLICATESFAESADQVRRIVVHSAPFDDESVLLSVADTGADIDPAESEHIFDSFYTPVSDRLGIGLAMTRSIVTAHGGRLWMTPNVPHGSVFQFTLSVHGPAATAVRRP